MKDYSIGNKRNAKFFFPKNIGKNTITTLPCVNIDKLLISKQRKILLLEILLVLHSHQSLGDQIQNSILISDIENVRSLSIMKREKLCDVHD